MFRSTTSVAARQQVLRMQRPFFVWLVLVFLWLCLIGFDGVAAINANSHRYDDADAIANEDAERRGGAAAGSAWLPPAGGQHVQRDWRLSAQGTVQGRRSSDLAHSRDNVSRRGGFSPTPSGQDTANGGTSNLSAEQNSRGRLKKPFVSISHEPSRLRARRRALQPSPQVSPTMPPHMRRCTFQELLKKASEILPRKLHQDPIKEILQSMPQETATRVLWQSEKPFDELLDHVPLQVQTKVIWQILNWRFWGLPPYKKFKLIFDYVPQEVTRKMLRQLPRRKRWQMLEQLLDRIPDRVSLELFGLKLQLTLLLTPLQLTYEKFELMLASVPQKAIRQVFLQDSQQTPQQTLEQLLDGLPEQVLQVPKEVLELKLQAKLQRKLPQVPERALGKMLTHVSQKMIQKALQQDKQGQPPQQIFEQLVNAIHVTEAAEVLGLALRLTLQRVPKETIKLVLENVAVYLIRRVLQQVPSQMPQQTFNQLLDALHLTVTPQVFRQMFQQVLEPTLPNAPSSVLRQIVEHVPQETMHQVLRQVSRQTPQQMLEQVVNGIPEQALQRILQLNFQLTLSWIPKEVFEVMLENVPEQVKQKLSRQLYQAPKKVFEQFFDDVPQHALPQVLQPILPQVPQLVLQLMLEYVSHNVIKTELLRYNSWNAPQKTFDKLVDDIPLQKMDRILFLTLHLALQDVPENAIRLMLTNVGPDVIQKVLRKLPFWTPQEMFDQLLDNTSEEVSQQVLQQVLQLAFPQVPQQTLQLTLEHAPKGVIRQVLRQVPRRTPQQMFDQLLVHVPQQALDRMLVQSHPQQVPSPAPRDVFQQVPTIPPASGTLTSGLSTAQVTEDELVGWHTTMLTLLKNAVAPITDAEKQSLNAAVASITEAEKQSRFLDQAWRSKLYSELKTIGSALPRKKNVRDTVCPMWDGITSKNYVVGGKNPILPPSPVREKTSPILYGHFHRGSVKDASWTVHMKLSWDSNTPTADERQYMPDASLTFRLPSINVNKPNDLDTIVKASRQPQYWERWAVVFDYKTGIFSFRYQGARFVSLDLKYTLMQYLRPKTTGSKQPRPELFSLLGDEYMTAKCPCCWRSEVIAGRVQLARQLLYGYIEARKKADGLPMIDMPRSVLEALDERKWKRFMRLTQKHNVGMRLLQPIPKHATHVTFVHFGASPLTMILDAQTEANHAVESVLVQWKREKVALKMEDTLRFLHVPWRFQKKLDATNSKDESPYIYPDWSQSFPSAAAAS